MQPYYIDLIVRSNQFLNCISLCSLGLAIFYFFYFLFVADPIMYKMYINRIFFLMSIFMIVIFVQFFFPSKETLLKMSQEDSQKIKLIEIPADTYLA